MQEEEVVDVEEVEVEVAAVAPKPRIKCLNWPPISFDFLPCRAYYEYIFIHIEYLKDVLRFSFHYLLFVQ